MKKSIIILLSCFSTIITFGQKSIEVGGMKINWKYLNGYVEFEVVAPNDGWVAIGFNSKNDIKDTHLLMFSIDDKSQQFEEFYVKDAGNPVPISELFESSSNLVYSCEEDNENTQVTFRIALDTYPQYSTPINEGTEIWLICAFSEEDDFEHHSMMRKHVKVIL